jgi:AhpD family alkylhydroperoxidase
MKVRMNYSKANPQALSAMLGLEKYIQQSGLDHKLYELIKLRASQINGCSYCLDMHARDLLKLGESMERIILLPVWREVPIYSEQERAILELTECVTRISEEGVPQAVYDKVLEYVDEKVFVDLIMSINIINSWNRIAISTGMFPRCLD